MFVNKPFCIDRYLIVKPTIRVIINYQIVKDFSRLDCDWGHVPELATTNISDRGQTGHDPALDGFSILLAGQWQADAKVWICVWNIRDSLWDVKRDN
jgi:hypothetical protein